MMLYITRHCSSLWHIFPAIFAYACIRFIPIFNIIIAGTAWGTDRRNMIWRSTTSRRPWPSTPSARCCTATSPRRCIHNGSRRWLFILLIRSINSLIHFYCHIVIIVCCCYWPLVTSSIRFRSKSKMYRCCRYHHNCRCSCSQGNSVAWHGHIGPGHRSSQWVVCARAPGVIGAFPHGQSVPEGVCSNYALNVNWKVLF